jgi:hypothetical protein
VRPQRRLLLHVTDALLRRGQKLHILPSDEAERTRVGPAYEAATGRTRIRLLHLSSNRGRSEQQSLNPAHPSTFVG